MVTHEMICTDVDLGLWECPSCGRRCLLNNERFRVLDQGDFEAFHFGSTVPDLVIGDVDVRGH
jgi:hypothetical protein